MDTTVVTTEGMFLVLFLILHTVTENFKKATKARNFLSDPICRALKYIPAYNTKMP